MRKMSYLLNYPKTWYGKLYNVIVRVITGFLFLISLIVILSIFFGLGLSWFWLFTEYPHMTGCITGVIFLVVLSYFIGKDLGKY